MEHLVQLMLPISFGVITSIFTFLFFEKKAIETKRYNEKENEKNNISLSENFKRYDTDRNVRNYSLVMLVFTLFVSYFAFFTQGLNLIDVFVYIFLTTFIGSAIIFALKIRKSILVKVFASFLYGAPLIASSIFGFLISYIIYANLK
ncbi:hypothetical protein MNB_SV-5-1459 [hydrothermal vent metagenome]|uniref:Uncharacterized protein n=1 Tax=hydrothermal vent metagenome TaxID=652676 RepID=A0A1W1EFI8_9ZZZZ